MEKPRGDFNNEAIYVSELIIELQKILEEHGDLPVFAGLDYSWISYVGVEDAGEYFSYKGRYVRLEA